MPRPCLDYWCDSGARKNGVMKRGDYESEDEMIDVVQRQSVLPRGPSPEDSIVKAMQKLSNQMENNRDEMEQRLQARLKMLDSRLERLSRQVDTFQEACDEVSYLPMEPTLVVEANGGQKFGNRGSMAGAELASLPLRAGSSDRHEGQKHDATTRASTKHTFHATSYKPLNEGTRKRSKKKTNQDWFERLVDHSAFDMVCASVVLFNSALVGAQINHEAVYDHDEVAYDYLEYVCTTFFTLELFLRIAARKRDFCHQEERKWAAFDVFLVFLSWLDISLKLIFAASGGVPGPGASLGKILKMARMARIMRILRMVKFLTNIRIMATLIVGSMVSLFWLLVLLLVVMYIFAIVLTQGATMWLKPDGGNSPPLDHSQYKNVRYYYGSLFRTIYTLFMAMTGGVSWGEPADTSQSYGWPYFVIFLAYVFFSIFSVMNIVTGVFVDGAIQQAQGDRTTIIEAQIRHKHEVAKSLEEVVCQLDVDDNGCLSQEEWDRAFVDPSVQGALAAIQVDVQECQGLFDMLDVDGDGRVDVKEFIQGMIRLKGWAKAIDIERLLSRVLRVHNSTKRILFEIEQLSQNIQHFGHQRASKPCSAIVRRC